MEEKIGKMKGSARPKEQFIFMKKHPIRWRLQQLLKALLKKVGP